MKGIRDALDGLDLRGGMNASLIMARYIKDIKGPSDKSDAAKDARRDLFCAMQSAVRSEAVINLYKEAFRRRSEVLNAAALKRDFKTRDGSVIAIGLGSSSVTETGLTLNPTFGTPMIPGSTLKGITAHYCSEVLGAADERYRGPVFDNSGRQTQPGGEIYETLFGKVGTDDVGDEAGYLSFYDAWITPDTLKDSLVNDVMTPHHGDYYVKGTEPTDFDAPNPVTFMAVKGTFEVRLGCEEPDADKRDAWLRFAMKIVKDALDSYGVGGKTRAGYGRMKALKSAADSAKEQAAAKAAADAAAGFMRKAGDVVSVICNKPNKKGNAQCKIDGKPVRFQTPLKASEGTELSLRILEINNDAYLVELVQ